MKLILPVILIILLFSCKPTQPVSLPPANRQLAITMDDPNSYDTPLMNWEERNQRILDALDHHHIKAALFVCGMRVNDAAGSKILKSWDDKGHMICNHSFSHNYYNAKSQTADAFIRDFRQNDSLINGYSNYTRLFRFPFLKEGNTIGKRDSARMELNQSGYKNGYVTIDASDWYIDTKIVEALRAKKDSDLTVYKDYYIHHIIDRAWYYDSLSGLLFHREIKHTLLIHHSLLNALFLDDLLTALEKNGWQLIDASEAYKDKVYRLQPEIVPCGESLIWQCAKLDPTLAPTLRYPGEDAEYEEQPLNTAIYNYSH